ncbi:MAG: HAMP domain-containing histidine kinase [Deltaproteobacteria bacterium]|nr:HAMP domain-containing histidine kinase [Deltaproteobacteria bacterium]
MAETLFEELKRYVRFEEEDGAALRALHPLARAEFPRISEVFYDRILEHDAASFTLREGESIVGHLRHTLVEWMELLLQGPWDEAYYEKRARIGRMHVRIALPQHYMFGAMSVLRQELSALTGRLLATDPAQEQRTRHAIAKILDLELAIMLHTYREDLLAQQGRAERLATFGQLVGSIGHELRNPLGVMESSLHILRGRLPQDERAHKHAGRIAEQLGIANSIITDLLEMIRERPLQTERLMMADVVDAAARQLSMQLDLTGLAGLPAVQGDAGQLRQIFVNLLDNARQAGGPAGRVTVEGTADATHVLLAVEDDGPGVDASIRRRLFEPLVTTKQKGIGLGLSLVKRFAERHGGTVTYEPQSRGARFVVRLPKAEAT